MWEIKRVLWRPIDSWKYCFTREFVWFLKLGKTLGKMCSNTRGCVATKRPTYTDSRCRIDYREITGSISFQQVLKYSTFILNLPSLSFVFMGNSEFDTEFSFCEDKLLTVLLCIVYSLKDRILHTNKKI